MALKSNGRIYLYTVQEEVKKRSFFIKEGKRKSTIKLEKPTQKIKSAPI